MAVLLQRPRPRAATPRARPSASARAAPRRSPARPLPPRRAAAAAATSSDEVPPLAVGAIVEEMPIFPLSGCVAFPYAETPLHIFEARYRVLFNTLLDGADDVEEGLVTDSPWRGTRAFGLCWSDGKGGVAGVGTRLGVTEHAQLEGGRMAINTKGVQRFKILSVIASAPIVTARVEILSDGDDADTPAAAAAAASVADAFRALLALNLRLGLIDRAAVASRWTPQASRDSDGSDDDGALEPPELATLAPAPLSFFLASYLADSPLAQQAMLQDDSTVARLQSLKEVIEGTVSFLRAKAAVDALGLDKKE